MDPIYSIRALNDAQFVNSYQAKWGTNTDHLTPSIKPKLYDSHEYLSPVQRNRLQKLFDRNLKIFYRYAVEELSHKKQSLDQASSIQNESHGLDLEKAASLNESLIVSKQEPCLPSTPVRTFRTNNPLLNSFDLSSQKSTGQQT